MTNHPTHQDTTEYQNSIALNGLFDMEVTAFHSDGMIEDEWNGIVIQVTALPSGTEYFLADKYRPFDDYFIARNFHEAVTALAYATVFPF